MRVLLDGAAPIPGGQKVEILPRVLPFILAIILGVLYAMYGGVATPSETAAVGALLCLLIAMVIYRLWNSRGRFGSVLRDSHAGKAVMILFIIAAAGVFSYMLSSLFITQSIAQWIGTLEVNRWVLMAAINVFLLVAGFFLPPVAVILMAAADPDADHHHGRLRPDLVRGRADDQHGDRADLAACRAQSLRHQRDCAGYSAEDDSARFPALRGLHGDRQSSFCASSPASPPGCRTP